MRIKLIHKEMTDEECLEQVKELYKSNPKIFMRLKEYKKRLRENSKRRMKKKWNQ